ncbi:MAG: hypothetical protein JKX71_04290 [Amylibacter sp.]|nr:hypothetical protein [Amylibacter sp.]
MNWYDIALMAAGSIGILVSIIHGTLMNSMMVQPALKAAALNKVSRRLLPVLMQFSTVCWFVGGIALIAAPFWFDASARLTTAIFVGSFYIYGAIGNLWGTKGRHFGWVLLAIAVMLIAYGTKTAL